MSAADRHTRWHFETRAARAGKDVPPAPGRPTATPIVPSSGFEQPDADAIDEVFAGGSGYVYARYHNPTVDALEHAVADLEGADEALGYASGMAAIAGAFAAVDPPRGARVIASRDLYGATVAWLEGEADRRGWELLLVDPSASSFAPENLEGVAAVYCESISNPMLRVFDVDTVAAACADAGVPLVLDATFTPPPLLHGLAHGATLVVHSATKYLGGHGDALAGVLAGPGELIAAARDRRKLDGTIIDPFTAWLVLRGLKTLPLRVERQCDNAARLVTWLGRHPAVERVHFPGLAPRDTEAELEVLARLLPGGRYGAMISFEIAGGGDREARRFLDRLSLWGTATTLGDLDSLALIPALTSHRKLSSEQRAELGITPSLVRLSVGVERVDDLIDDLDRALSGLG